jgi:hypothetical protein
MLPAQVAGFSLPLCSRGTVEEISISNISFLCTEVLLGENSPFTQREEDVLSIGFHSIAHFSISAMAIRSTQQSGMHQSRCSF